MVATPDVLDRIAAATQELLYVRLRQVAAKEGSLWVLVRLASSAYFQDSTLSTANTQAQLVQLTQEQSGALLERELLVPSALLKTLLAEKWLQVGRSAPAACWCPRAQERRRPRMARALPRPVLP